MKANPSKGFIVCLIILSLFLCIGVQYFFPACQGLKDDGSLMRCHTAQDAIAITAGIGAVLYIVAFFLKNLKARACLVFLSIPLSIATILFANNMVFLLCMSMDMQCWSLMRPITILLSIVIMVVGAVDGVITMRQLKQNRHA